MGPASVQVRRRRMRSRGPTGLVIGLVVVATGFGALVYTLNRAVEDLGDLGRIDFDLDLPGSARATSFAPRAVHGARPRWVTRTEAGASAPPVVAAGNVLVRGQVSRLQAYDAASGAPRWSRDVGGGPLAVQFAPVVAGGTAYVTGGRAFRPFGVADVRALSNGTGPLTEAPVLALDAATGAVRWSTKMHGAGGHPLTVAGSDVYVNADTLASLDASTGAVRWVAAVGNPPVGGYSAPAVLGDVVAVGGGDGLVHAFDRATGVARWTVPVSAAHDVLVGAGPVVAAAGETFLVVASDSQLGLGDTGPGHLRVLDPATGAVRWSRPVRGVTGSGTAPAVDGSTVFVPGVDVRASDIDTGVTRWIAPIRPDTAFAFTPLRIDDGMVFVPGADGRLHVLDTGSGRPLGRVGAPPDSDESVTVVPPGLAGDTAYLASADVALYAYPLRALRCRPGPAADPACSRSRVP